MIKPLAAFKRDFVKIYIDPKFGFYILMLGFFAGTTERWLDNQITFIVLGTCSIGLFIYEFELIFDLTKAYLAKRRNPR